MAFFVFSCLNFVFPRGGIRLFIFSHGVLIVFSHGVFSSSCVAPKRQKDEMAQSSHHTNVCLLYANVIFAFQRQPTELLPHLFIGDEQDSSNKEVLDKIGITAILNVSNTCQSLFTSQYTYKVIPVQDKNNENILVWFAEAIQFIGELSCCQI